MAMQGAVVLLVGLSLAAAEEALSHSGSYTAPEPAVVPQYQPPAAEYPSQQYDVPEQQYEAPEQQYRSPAQQYASPQPSHTPQHTQSFTGYGNYQQATKALFAEEGSYLSKFSHDWLFTGIAVASLVILLSIVGIVVVPSLPFTASIMPSITSLFEVDSLVKARSMASSVLSSGMLDQLEMADVADAVNYVETAIERARSFIDDLQQW